MDMLNPNGDPRGPLRRVVVAADDPRTNHFVEFECGHKAELAQHFWYKVGSQMHCFKCGPLAHQLTTNDHG